MTTNSIETKYLLDVAVLTYNQEAYIGHCLETIMEQNHPFGMRVTIYDDCSTDGTSAICAQWAGRYPEIIRYKKHPKNIGITANWIYAIHDSNSKYLAICEGDDYWTDPGKLKKQIGLMEDRADCAICHHPVIYLSRQAAAQPQQTQPDSFSIEWQTLDGLADGNFIVTSSAVFRRSCIPALPQWFATIPVCDYSLFMLTARQGKITLIKQPMAVYRNDGGAFSGLTTPRKYLAWIEGISHLQNEFVEHPFVRARLLHSMLAHQAELLNNGDHSATRFVEAAMDGVVDTYYYLVREHARLLQPASAKQAFVQLKEALIRKFSFF